MADQPQEVEIKFRIDDIAILLDTLPSSGFRTVTKRTHERNTLYDLPGLPLRDRGAILRIRQYGSKWTVTYKDRKGSATATPHKSRREIETELKNGSALAQILEAAGFHACFAYEKYRSEWTDGTGYVVIDETPVGNFGEIEGPPAWIDSTAKRLGVAKSQYLVESYAELFNAWKSETGSKANNMLFADCA
jgi:adenylate cyclase class 2